MDGFPHGRGLVKYCNMDVYEGDFKRNSRHGEGSCIYANGECFKGRWFEDEMLLGTLTLADGTVQAINESR